VPADIDPRSTPSLVALMEESFRSTPPRVAYSFMGKDVTFARPTA
jgi:long-chain acyl-CoA synthetase